MKDSYWIPAALYSYSMFCFGVSYARWQQCCELKRRLEADGVEVPSALLILKHMLKGKSAQRIAEDWDRGELK